MLKKLTNSVVSQVLIAAVLGVFTGLLIGDHAANFKPIGQIYTMLMEVVVYPYLICTLITSLGDLTPQLTLKLLRRGWLIYASLILLTFTVLVILAYAIPVNIVVAPTSEMANGSTENLLKFLVPENFFYDLANNYVPAVIIFCILFALVLQHIPNKTNLFIVLKVISQTCLLLWGWLVKVVPIATFALLANIAGTIRLNQLLDVGEFLILFLVGTALLLFWLLPIIISHCTGLRYKTILYELRDPLIVSAVTTLSVVSLPYLQKITSKLLLQQKQQDEQEVNDVLETLLLINYPLAQLGNFFVYLFIIFAALYYDYAFRHVQYDILPFITFLSSIGSPSSTINAVSFLSQWLGLPTDTTGLYLSLMPLIRYGQVLVSVMGFAFLAIIIMFALFGMLKINYKKIGLHLFLAFLFLGIFVIILQTYIPNPGEKSYHRLNSLTIDYARFNVQAKILPPFDESTITLAQAPQEDALFRIQRTGVIRIGFNADMRPFSFFNDKHQLVGYDIAYAYALAKALNSRIEFIPFTWQYLVSDLQANKFDIAMSAIYVTEMRLSNVAFTEPYFESPFSLIVPAKQQEQYQSAEKIKSISNLRIGLFNDPVLIPLVQKNFPQAKIVILNNLSNNDPLIAFNNNSIDAVAWSKAQTDVWVLAHPDYVSLVPVGIAAPFLMAYMVPRNSPQFLSFLNYWLELKKTDGFQQEMHNRWILIRQPQDTLPRWSILNI